MPNISFLLELFDKIYYTYLSKFVKYHSIVVVCSVDVLMVISIWCVHALPKSN